MDFGRILIIVIFGFILCTISRKKSFYDDFFKKSFIIVLSQFIVFFPVTVLFTKFIGHRYLLPIIIPLSICTGYWIIKYFKFREMFLLFAFVILISGYFWIYSFKIAQGWDSTPAHWPYYNIRNEMIKKITSSNISFAEVGSFFPNIASTKFIDLAETDMEFTEANLKSDKFILYSNVYNAGDEYIDELFNEKKWQRFIEEQKGNFYNPF